MNDLLIALAGIALLTNFIYTIWSYFSLRRLSKSLETAVPQEKFILENIVHSRSSINLLYASVAIVAFVLGFFGYNIQKNVREEVRKDITEAARIDLDSLKVKAQSVSLIESLARQHSAEITKTREQIHLFFEGMRKSPQKLFVVQALPVSKQRYRYSFSELKPVDGTTLPPFTKPPVMLWYAYNERGTYAIGVTATTQGIEVSTYDEPFVVDLWIYAQ